MSHRLHLSIGSVIRNLALPDCRVIMDPACGGQQHIPLFQTGVKSRATRFCNVDLLILQHDKIRVIMEIEEANVKPTQICGKLLTSAISSYYIHETGNNIAIGMGDAVVFIQVLDISKLKEDKTSKIGQWKNIEKSIQAILPFEGRNITEYRVFWGDSDTFIAPNHTLVQFLKERLADETHTLS